MQQQIQAGQGAFHAEPGAYDLGDAGRDPTLGFAAPHRRAGVEQPGQLGQLGGAEPAARAARALGGRRRPAAGGQRSPPPARRHPAHLEPGRYLPVAGALPDPLGRRQPDPLAPGPLLGGQPPPSGYLTASA